MEKRGREEQIFPPPHKQWTKPKSVLKESITLIKCKNAFFYN